MVNCVSFTAPRYTAEQERADRSALTQEEKEELEAEVFGIGSGRAAEAESQLEELTKEVEALLEQTPFEQKQAFQQAVDICPDLVQEETHPVKFLRSVEYDPARAAQRIINFWDVRLDLFGTERAFLPMTLEGAMAEDMEALEGAWPMTFEVPKRDLKGRKIMTCDRSYIDTQRFERNVLLRLIFYTAFNAVRDPQTQICGVVGVVYNDIKAFDRILFKKWQRIVMGDCIPIRICATHSVRNPPMMEWFLPVIKWFLARNDRLRTYVHGGTSVVVDLAPFGITSESLPVSIGGDFVFVEKEYLKKMP